VIGRRGNDIRQLHEDGLEWRGGIILGWAGMRGVVTVAAAQSLPDDIPHRNQLVLIAFTVAVVTLMLQGGTLPWLIRMLGVQGTDATADRREFASLLAELNHAGLQVLDDATDSTGEPVDPSIIDRVRHDTEVGTNLLHEQVEAADDPTKLADLPLSRYRMLRYEVLRAEREALLLARSEGRYASRILVRAQTVLDLEEARLAQFDTN